MFTPRWRHRFRKIAPRASPGTWATAYTSTRLHVERTTTSAATPDACTSPRTSRSLSSSRAICSRTDTGAFRWLRPLTKRLTSGPVAPGKERAHPEGEDQRGEPDDGEVGGAA